MTVTVHNRNGIRYGTYDLDGIKGKFPRQIITTTNLNHEKSLDTTVDFKTNFLEIIEKYTERLLTDTEYRKSRIDEVSKIIENNPERICLLVLNGSRSSLKATKENNVKLINFQINVGFSRIKVFFKDPRNALDNLDDYRYLIPNTHSLVPIFDENMDSDTFKDLYAESYTKKSDEIIGFLGREPNENKDDNRLNFQFIASRPDDKVIRLVSFTKKNFGGIVGSLVYHWFGYDMYSFITRFGPQNKAVTEIQALDGFSYVPLTRANSFHCVATGRNLYDSVKHYESQKKSSIPVSLYNMCSLNDEFEIIHNKYTRPQIESILEDRIF